MVNAPYRIAFLRPELRVEGAAEHVAALLAWFDLYDRCLVHPSLAITSDEEASIGVVDGTYAPVANAQSGVPKHLFHDLRCDEVLWLDASLGSREVRLCSEHYDGHRSTASAVGNEGAFGELVGRALDVWLAERGFSASSPRATYTSAELLDAAARLAPALSALAARPPPAEGEGAKPPATPDASGLPATIAIAMLRAFGACAEVEVATKILELDGEHPWALHAALLARPGDVDVDALRKIIALAPAWGAPYRSLPGSSDLETLGASGFATVCRPMDRRARRAHADALIGEARHEHAVRIHERTRDESPYSPSAWLPLLGAQPGREAIGRWRRTSGWGANTVGIVVGGYIMPWSEPRMRVDLHASSSLKGVGLLGEAIALRANRLEGLEARYARENAVLDGWRKEARYVAWGYAREGYFRGEDARVLEGFSRAEPNDGVDLGMFMESLLACGRGPEAILAWAHLGRGRGLDTPFARLAAVRVFLAEARYREAFELHLKLLLDVPHRGYQAALDRSARMFAYAELEDLEGFVVEQLERGAPTLARLAAREIADFVPGADHSEAITHALGARTPTPFERSWLAGAKSAPSREAIDALFTLDGDQMIERWPDVRFAEVAEDDEAGTLRATTYLFTQALARYLASTTEAPSVRSGALRTVASEALLALVHAEREVELDDVRALFSAMERSNADPAILDAWLLRIEHALHLEERTHGHLGDLVEGCPKVAALLRGPEQIAVETLAAAELMRTRPEGFAAEASPLLERLVRSSGTSGLTEWAEAAFEAEGPEALDVVQTAAWRARDVTPGPGVLAAKMLFARGSVERAFEALCEGLSACRDEAWRDAQLATIRPAWEASGLDVPFDFTVGVRESIECLQNGDPQRAARLLTWLLAFDPSNPEGQRNFGLAYAMLGDIERTLTHLGRATRDQDTQFASGMLFQAGHAPLAMRVLDYASQWYTRAEQWITFGAIAYQMMDNPRTVIAYANAWELDPDEIDASNLNSYAGVLDEVGDYATCERIARRLLDVAGDDAMWASNGWNHLACAHIGFGRMDVAKACAEKAIAMNPLPDNAQPFADTLARASSGARPEVPPPLPAPVPRHDAYVTLEQGEIKAVLAEFAASRDVEARIAVLRASRFRYGSDNYVEVTAPAREAAQRLVAETNDAETPLAGLARTFALDVREQARFPLDPMPMLGDRGTREAFYAEFRDRGGIIVGQPPVETVPFEDREVCPGSPLPNASDYVRLLQAMQRQAPAAALASIGLDEARFVEVAEAWGRALRHEPGLAALLEAGLRAS